MSLLGLTQLDNGRRVPARVGDALVVSLPENGSTGYGWEPLADDELFTEAVGEAQCVCSSDAISSVRQHVPEARAAGQTLRDSLTANTQSSGGEEQRW